MCRLCEAGLTSYDGAWCCGAYDGALRDLIHLFKYGRMLPLGRVFGQMMARAYPRDQLFEVLVPVPSHWRRRLWRGFDQAAVLARELSRRTAIPVEQALRRNRHTPPQAGLTRRQRRDNIRGCFVAARPEAVRGRRVLLIDDVLTTGATVNAAAAVLRRAGAAHVGVFTLARADRGSLSGRSLLLADAPFEVSAHESEH
ncbi:MAG: ComF family protein [Bryobacteraceae bacterium]|jgi:ComF family protein